MQSNSTSPRRRYRTVPRACESCGVAFFAYPYEVRDGNGRFCSRSCGKLRDLALSVAEKIGHANERGCRPWLAKRDRDGYGHISYRGKDARATHAVWFMNTGHWPIAGEVIAHTTCDWPPCCEFSHLSLTDNAGNTADKVSKGRQIRGERHYAAKLTDLQVLEMRARYAAGDASMTALAREYGIGYAAARSAINGEHWKHVTPPSLAAV